MVALIQVLLTGTEETRLSTRLFSFYFFIPHTHTTTHTAEVFREWLRDKYFESSL
jgi:hypothetical protein